MSWRSLLATLAVLATISNARWSIKSRDVPKVKEVVQSQDLSTYDVDTGDIFDVEGLLPSSLLEDTSSNLDFSLEYAGMLDDSYLENAEGDNTEHEYQYMFFESTQNEPRQLNTKQNSKLAMEEALLNSKLIRNPHPTTDTTGNLNSNMTSKKR